MVCVSNLFSFAFDDELKTFFKIAIFNLASLPKDICININMATMIKIKESSIISYKIFILAGSITIQLLLFFTAVPASTISNLVGFGATSTI